uniref:DUF3533 domain-containing protein n=1 Tax=Parastrongyloides trichosuri TaxID=131310 RepID=A0A0N4ZHQ6_PARTI
MTDPYACLRASSICIAGWSILFCLIQYAVLGWQVSYVRGLTWEYENRQVPFNHGLDGLSARFPGLYALYTETPERRRINALFTIVIICLGLNFIHFFASISLLYGTIKRVPSAIWPWFCSIIPNIMLTTAYAVLWWSGDVFNEQLTMSVAEFIMSIGINSICFAVVLFYYLRLSGSLTSTVPAGYQSRPLSRQHLSRPPSQKGFRRNDPKYRSHEKSKQFFADWQLNDGQREPYPKGTVPPWRTQWDPEPPKPFVRQYRDSQRQRQRESLRKSRNRSFSPTRPPTRPHSRTQYQCVPLAYHPEEMQRMRSRSASQLHYPRHARCTNI